MALIVSIPSAEFKGIFGLKRGNKGQLTWRQKNNVFSAILELIRCIGPGIKKNCTPIFGDGRSTGNRRKESGEWNEFSRSWETKEGKV